VLAYCSRALTPALVPKVGGRELVTASDPEASGSRGLLYSYI
jgi:hypothetical protein